MPIANPNPACINNNLYINEYDLMKLKKEKKMKKGKLKKSVGGMTRSVGESVGKKKREKRSVRKKRSVGERKKVGEKTNLGKRF